MADEARDFMLDDNGRLIIRNGGVATGLSLTQEVALVLVTNKGEMRNDTLCGCDLTRLMKSPLDRVDLERTIRIQLERDGKSWDRLKDGINTTLDNA